MVATPIGTTSRYIPEGVRHFYYVPAVADLSSPTRSELDAGTDLTPEVNAFGNWGLTSAAVDTPDLASRFTSSVPGLITVDGPTINMYASDDSDDVRSLLPRDTEGFIVSFPEGDVTGHTMDVFPVKVASAEKTASLGGNPALVELTFTVTSEPSENVVVPA